MLNPVQVYPRSGPCAVCMAPYGFPAVKSDWRTWHLYWRCLGPEAHTFTETIVVEGNPGGPSGPDGPVGP